MHIDALENSLFEMIANPFLKRIIGLIDQNCPSDGNLLLNSLRNFLGKPVSLCPSCKSISTKISRHLYRLGSSFLRVDREFMQHQFLDDQFGQAWFRGFGLMMKGVEKYGVRIPFTPAGPFEIVWNLTHQCNLRCKHCYENAGQRRPELSTDEAKQVLDKLSGLSGIGLPALSFSGGEPLARKDFFEIASYAKRRVGYLSIATNGTLITRDNAERIKDAGVDYVEISIDGATPGVHDSFRGIPGAFEKAMEGVENCLWAGMDICIATVLHRDNFVELEKIVELSKELGTRFMHFNYIPTGRAKGRFELDLNPSQRHQVLETIGKEIVELYLQKKEEEIKLGRSDTKVDKFFSTCPQYASVTKELSKRKGRNFIVEAHYAAKQGVEKVANFLGGCGAGRLYCCLEPNGDIKPCVFFQTSEDTVLGNILKDNFENIWDNNPLLWRLRMREDLEDLLVQGKKVGCGQCPDRYICGGCRARAYSYFNGNVKMPDVGCIHNQPAWEKLVNSRRWADRDY